MDCGRLFPSWIMEFDHVRGTKLANMSRLAGRSRDVILYEAAKCDVVCSNCHRQREHDRYLDRHVDAAYDADLDAELACDTAFEVSQVQLDTSAPVLFQHRSDTGFNSVEIGRASLLLNGVRYRAKYLGTDGNALVVNVRVNPMLQTIAGGADRTGITVGVPTGTTNLGLASAVNRFAGSLIVAYAVTPSVVALSGSGQLAGGLDPSTVGSNRYCFDAPTGTQGGLLYHFLNRNQYITQVEGSFTIASPTPVQVQVVSLSEGFEPIPDEYGQLYCTTLTVAEPSFVITDARLQLLPYRALRVICAAPGTVRAQFQQAAVQTMV
jgi:hypothetical protein